MTDRQTNGDLNRHADRQTDKQAEQQLIQVNTKPLFDIPLQAFEQQLLKRISSRKKKGYTIQSCVSLYM